MTTFDREAYFQGRPRLVPVEPHEDVEPVPITIPPKRTATVQPPSLAHERDILERVAEAVARMGVAGERRVIKLIYLITTTRLLDRIVSLAVKGPSSAGKSYLVEQTLSLFPEPAYYALSAMSERALIYDETPLVHRMLVIYEAAGMAGDLQTYIIRSLLSEGRVRYITVEKSKGGMTPRLIERAGPTGLITTTTEIKLHPENETRLLSLTVTDSPAQTQAVLLAHATGAPDSPDLRPWHALQAWLANGAAAVSIPYLVTLARNIPAVAVRLRRDFPAVTALIKAHALLHQLHRERDASGAILATIEDYAAVRELVADLVADAAERSVPETVRETVERVRVLTYPEGETTVVAVGQALGLDKSAASRRVRVATERGYLRNLEDKRGRPSRLVVGDPLPEEQTILPNASDLERLHGCSATAGGKADDAERLTRTYIGADRGPSRTAGTDEALVRDGPRPEPLSAVVDDDPAAEHDDDGRDAYDGPIPTQSGESLWDAELAELANDDTAEIGS